VKAFTLADDINAPCNTQPRVSYRRKGRSTKGMNINHAGRLSWEQGKRILVLYNKGLGQNAIRRATGHGNGPIRAVCDGEYLFKEDVGK